MVKAVLAGNKKIISKNLNTPKDGFVQKKRNNKFKQTPTGKISLINGSKARNNKNVKEQNLQKKTSNSPQKSFEKSKDQRKRGHPNNDKQKDVSLQRELSKKKATLVSEKDDSDSEIEEDVNEGVVIEDESMVDESDNCEDEEESDDDESEEEKNLPNILGHSLADESDEDDDDYRGEEDEKNKNVHSNKTVKMFKGLKRADSSSESVKSNLDNSTLEETLTDDNNEENDDDSGEEEEEDEEEEGGDDEEDETDDDDDEEIEEEDRDSNQDEDEDESEDEDEDDDEEDEEEEDEADESALGLKALLDNTIADDDEDDEDFVESGENDEDDDISDEEDEEEEEEDGNSTLDNSQQNTNTQGEADTSLEKIKTDKRTIFVGNLPVSVKREQLHKLFKKFGTIETIRLRGTIPKSLNVSKKVAAKTKNVHPKLKSVYAYILYASEKSAKAALAMNGTVFEGNYLRVDTADKSENKYDSKKSVFLGNLSFKLDDNTLRKHFEQCGEIESVRVVRDNRTGLSKGIGFVNFKTEDAAALALELDGTELLNREIRVKPNIERNKDNKGKHGKRSHSEEGEPNVAHKKSKNNESVAVPVHNKQNAVKRTSDKEQQVGKKQISPQQGKAFQGQKADASKKKKKNKLEKKKKILAEKLTAKSKKPSN